MNPTNIHLNCEKFYHYLRTKEINFFTGVPDSLLKDFCGYISDNVDSSNHLISTNEGSSVGLAIGYYLSTGKLPLVYMQNSGFGNVVNPLLSLADSKVYKIPMLLMIGWRGQPGIKDEPQHIKQGEVTIPMIKAMGLDYIILNKELKKSIELIDKLIASSLKSSSPSVILVEKGTFSPYEFSELEQSNLKINRETAISIVLSNIEKNSIIVSTTGKASREVFEYRVKNNQSHKSDFLTVGGMGHSSQIALGISMQKLKRKIYCLDGDGAALMHLGSLGLIGEISPKNFIHIIINNGAHDSVGGQPTIGHKINFTKIATQLNYKYSFRCSDKEELEKIIYDSKKIDGPILIEILTIKGARRNLGRPTISPVDNKNNFMNFLNE